ncbi:hypothetical protein C3488_08775 [Streptomyces sp. Ru72]|nr:hypothetical protein C3488_08775 [Streptomyces sp. Ru72]
MGRFEGWGAQFGFDWRLERCALKDGDGDQAAVVLELRLLDGQPPVEFCLCHELLAVDSMGEKSAAATADMPGYGTAERDVGAVGSAHPVVAGGREVVQRVGQEPQGCVLDARSLAVLDEVKQDRVAG